MMRRKKKIPVVSALSRTSRASQAIRLFRMRITLTRGWIIAAVVALKRTPAMVPASLPPCPTPSSAKSQTAWVYACPRLVSAPLAMSFYPRMRRKGSIANSVLKRLSPLEVINFWPGATYLRHRCRPMSVPPRSRPCRRSSNCLSVRWSRIRNNLNAIYILFERLRRPSYVANRDCLRATCCTFVACLQRPSSTRAC